MTTDIRLTEWTTCGGCAAKWGFAELKPLLAGLRPATDPALLVGLAPFDDAAVYRLSDELALVSTTDFFPPLVDDPEDFGAVAAANACSDVFAMGGQVVLALNVAAFPERLPPVVIDAVFRGAAAVVAEAGGTVAGGHTIRSEEPLFGLAVSGLVHPDRVWTKSGACPGDALVLSKPLGTGLVLAGGSEGEKATTVAHMRAVNREAANVLSAGASPPHAVTDVTGFGLAGHGGEMAQQSGGQLRFEVDQLPVYPGAREAAARGVRTGGDPRNRAALEGRVRTTVGEIDQAIFYDPQTSGGLLAAVDPAEVDRLVAAGFSVVGTITAGDPSVALD